LPFNKTSKIKIQFQLYELTSANFSLAAANLQLLNNKTIIKTKVLLPQAKVTIADFGYSI
jgi:hypothetical protein